MLNDEVHIPILVRKIKRDYGIDLKINEYCVLSCYYHSFSFASTNLHLDRDPLGNIISGFMGDYFGLDHVWLGKFNKGS